MKQIVFIMFFLSAIFCSCGSMEENKGMRYDHHSIVMSNTEEPVQNPVKTNDEGEFAGVRNEPIDFDDMVGVYGSFRVDAKLALELANVVVRSTLGEEFLESTTYLVYEVQEQNLFVVHRLPNIDQDGGGIGVAISKTDGAVLRIWMGE